MKTATRAALTVLAVWLTTTPATAQESAPWPAFDQSATGNHAEAGATAASLAGTRADKQGGDDLADAVEITTLPYADTGTTCGHGDDLGFSCGSTNSNAHDVVYAFTPDEDFLLTIDLCGSAYDTRIFVLDAGLDLIDCNDDTYDNATCGSHTSYLADVPLTGGQAYYLVVDGTGVECGDYLLNVSGEAVSAADCVVGCSGASEGEPNLTSGYIDAYNGGCNSPDSDYPQQLVAGDIDGGLSFCGRSGWYVGVGGAVYRDTDWFWTVIGQSGRMEWTLESEQAIYGFVLAPHDCDEFSIARTLEADPCDPQTLVLTGEPGEIVWLWVGPQTLQVPAGALSWQFDYRCDFIGLMPEVLSAEPRSWGAIKSMYR